MNKQVLAVLEKALVYVRAFLRLLFLTCWDVIFFYGKTISKYPNQLMP
ncbi:MAG: hypothetical protein Q8S55_05830 [Methylococcaceae bacterium]|nr:hypothetical protein [Methylococcaceae bacterium]